MTKNFVSKLTVQAGLAAIVGVTACVGFYFGKLSADQFSLIAVMAFAWAFGKQGGSA